MTSTNNNIVANNNDHIYLQIKLFQFQLHIFVKKLLFKFLSIFFVPKNSLIGNKM